jgi:hypothetical protein
MAPLILTLQLGEGKLSKSCPRKEPRYLLNGRLYGPQNRFEICERKMITLVRLFIPSLRLSLYIFRACFFVLAVLASHFCVYCTTHNTFMPPAGFEPTIPDRAATGIGNFFFYSLYSICTSSSLSSLCLLPLLHNTHNTNIHVPSWIRTRDPSKRSAADPRLRPHGHWDRQTQTPQQPPLNLVAVQPALSQLSIKRNSHTN